jgi:anti-sigma factor RsiW
MNCRSAEPLLSAFLEDDLSQTERRNLESHLLSCRRCSHAVRGLRATMELLQTIPEVETSPHFEADLLARIRSGEGLRPSVIEWLRTYLEPARLRPLFLAGAGACAIWISVLLVGPSGLLHATNPRLAQSKAKGAPAISPAPVVASAPTTQPGSATVAARSNGKPQGSPSVSRANAPGYAWADPSFPAKSGQDTVISNPGSRYDDEYVTDQFIIQRGLESSNNRTITPVSDRQSDDVFITF